MGIRRRKKKAPKVEEPKDDAADADADAAPTDADADAETKDGEDKEEEVASATEGEETPAEEVKEEDTQEEKPAERGSLGFGFVNFLEHDCAVAAIEALNDREFATEFFILADLKVQKGEVLEAEASATEYTMCPRCRRYEPLLDSGLCARCEDVVNG